MKFTIVFPSTESSDLSIGAVFIPCLVWMDGEKELLNPHRENPHYVRGDLQAVLALPGNQKRLSAHTKKVVVVCHPVGHGTENYLDDILSDLRDSGFSADLIRL
jgi:hypothetical protein